MRPARLAVAALVLAFLAPTVAQEDRKPYFSLASNRTWLPGEKPTVQMWSQHVTSLEYRIYRIKDPVAFFQKMEDPHRLGPGMAAPRKKREITLIEKIHRFKKSFRESFRDSLRAQFSDPSRSVIHGWISEPKPPSPATGATKYAELPVLNPQQLVATFRQNVPQAKRWESQTIPIDVKDRGVYLVEAAHENLRAYTIVIVTEMAILTKTAPGRMLASVVDARAGTALEASEVRVLAGPQAVAMARTAGDGLAELRLPEPTPDSVVLLASHGGDFTASGIDSWSISSDPERSITGYVYTDRPIYRPGHMVHVKAIVRRQTTVGWEMPEDSKLNVEINDPEGKTVFRKDSALTSMGTVQFDYELPAGAALGYYSVQFHAGAEFSGGFQVEEYKKPEYEVRVSMEPRRVLQGQPIQATLSARYFFGEPVKSARVTWVVHRFRHWYPAYADDQDDVNPEESDGGWGGEQLSEESGQLDADGKLTVKIPTTEDEQRHDMRYRVEARVTDAANREISGASSALATRGSFLVHIEGDRYVYQPDENATFTLETRDYDGNPVPQTPVRVELREWRGKGGEMAAAVSAAALSDAQGVAKISLKASTSGSYRATAFAKTPEGRDVQDQTWIWVTGSAGGWYSEKRERLQLVPDKKSYKAGDRAKILIVTGTPSARVLVTAEGAEILSRQIVDAKSPAVTVEIPVKREYAPNFYVTAAFIRDNQLYEGTRKIKVPASDRQLQVEVTPSKKEYKPGEAAVYKVVSRDSAGKPVPAELSLGVVDEAIYSIRPDMTQDIFRFFYGVAANRVGTNTSLNYYFSGEAGTRRMQLASLRSRRNLAQLKPEALVQPKVRKAFPDTAYWVANLTTDSSGQGEARFEWPDALTTWRATARGITRDTKAGSAVDKVIVRKNLMVRLSAPRFFTEGDEVTISLLVHNYLKSDKIAKVSLEAKGLELTDGGTRDVRVPSGGDAKVDYHVRARKDRDAVLTAKALTNEESDALEITLPVNPFGVKLAKASGGSLSAASAEQGVDLMIPADVQPGSQSLELRVTPSVAGAIFGALEYLTKFPYGCTEQTMSSFLPNIMVSQALRELNVPSKVDAGELRRKITAGLDRLYGFQHEDGGWGWWETDESHPFMTAYVVSGLAQARTASQGVRNDVMDRGRTWLRSRLATDRKLKPDLQAYMVYAIMLAGEKDPKILDAGWASQTGMTSYGAALLGLAMRQAGDSRAEELSVRLEAKAVTDGQVARWEVADDNLMDFHGDTSVEATAFALKLLTQTRHTSPLLEKAAYWLVTKRDDGYYWNTTKQTAMAIYGLIDYVKQSKELKPHFTVTISKGDRQLLSRRFTDADVFSAEPPVIRLSAADVAAGSNVFKITKSGEGRLYWSARAEYYSAGEQLSGTGSASLSISREYFRLTPVQEGGRVIHQLEPLTGPLAPGDVLAVRLVVSGGPWRYLMTEDPIPSGAEFVTRDDLYQIRNKPPWWQFGFTRREFRDDRAALFHTYFSRETMQQIYLLKVVNPGTFRISPARAQPMYQPQFLATSDSRVLEVR